MNDYGKTLARWPRAWSIDSEIDLPTGTKMVRVFEKFVSHLERSVSHRTMLRHLKYLHLLGGKIIDDLNRELHPERRSLSGPALLLAEIPDGVAPAYRHVPFEDEPLFDCTCKKLHRFLTTAPQSRSSHERATIPANR